MPAGVTAPGGPARPTCGVRARTCVTASTACLSIPRARAPQLPPSASPAALYSPFINTGNCSTVQRWRKHQRLPYLTAAPVAATAVTAATGAPAAAAAAAAVASSPAWMDLFAVVLGYVCLAGSLFRSVPQIAVILRTGSAEGLSLTSNLVELLCFTISVAYNMQQGYAFNTYGEVFACWIQDAIIVGLIFRHMRLPGTAIAASTAAFAAACALLFSPACPMQVLSALQLSTVVVMAVGARLPQIWLNVQRGNAGVLSPLTCGLNVAGCMVRTFTTAVLTRDAINMGGCVSQLILNAILLYQAVATPGTPATATTTPTAAAATAATATTATAATVTAAAAAAVAATDPPATGGMGPARGQPAVGARGSGADDGSGGSSSGSRPAGGDGSGRGGGGRMGGTPPVPLPVAPAAAA